MNPRASTSRTINVTNTARMVFAKCQERTFRHLFDHLVGNSKNAGLHCRVIRYGSAADLEPGQFANRTGKAAFAKTCWVAPPNIHCLNRLCV